MQHFLSWLEFKDLWPAMLFFANFCLVLLGVGLWKNLHIFSFLDFNQQGLLTGAQWSCLMVEFHFHLLSILVPFRGYHIGLQRNPCFLLPRLQTARTFDWCSMIMFSVPVPFRGDHIGLRRNPLWKEVLAKNSLQRMDRFVVFADIVNKINRSNGKARGLCLLKDNSCVPTNKESDPETALNWQTNQSLSKNREFELNLMLWGWGWHSPTQLIFGWKIWLVLYFPLFETMLWG